MGDLVCLAAVIFVFGGSTLAMLIQSWNASSRRRHEASLRRQELESRERQLKHLPEIISTYLGVTQDQAKADELSALLTGMINGSSSSSTVELHQKLDRIIALLGEEEEPSTDELRLKLEQEHTRRVNAVLAHVRETSRPSPQELHALLKMVRPSEGVPSTGVRIDPSAVRPNGTEEGQSAPAAQQEPRENPAEKKEHV